MPSSSAKAAERLWAESEADYRAQILELVPRQASSLLDVGCEDGAWTAEIARTAGIEHVAGIEIVEEARAQARGRGFDVRSADLEEAWPFGPDEFDVVHANQVIEHVKRLDHFVKEIARVLRPAGQAIVCTENLASWHNVVAAALGYMPFSLTNISEIGPVGNPYAGHEGREEPFQHVRVLTLDGLEDIFRKHSFVIRHRFGSGYYPAFGKVGGWLAHRDPRHAHFIGVVAEKTA